MIQFILGLGTMLVVAFLFTKIRGFIFKRAKKTIIPANGNIAKQYRKQTFQHWNNPKVTNASIGKSYKKGKEPFSWTKFKKIFDLGNGVEWIKSCKEILDLRKLTIYCIVLGAFFAYGYFKGQGDTPIKIDLDYAKEFKMKLDGHYLVKPKNSQNIKIEDKEGNLIKTLKVKDFPLLAKKSKPIGFVLEPIGIAGLGAGGDKKGVEYGAGVGFIKYWKYKLDGFLTNRGIYVGTSYQITDNTGLGLGVGKGFAGDNRVILYGRVKF